MRDLHPDDVVGARRWLCKNDLYYLLRYELSTKYSKRMTTGEPLLEADFIFDRCREVQAQPNGFLDLWARYHFKTTIVTFGYTIQTILRDPERTTVILSQNNKAATKKLLQIKHELENNHEFIELFNDIFEHDPLQYKLWSQEKGLVVKRRGNPAVATVAAFGLVDSQPTGDHYTDRVYDDVVVPESVVSDVSISNTNNAWELSLNLGMEGGVARYVGTRYHFNDTYALMIERSAVVVRRYPCYKLDEFGKLTDVPVLYDKDYLANERKSMGPYTWACQMLLDPVAESQQGFDVNWVRHYVRTPREERSGRIVYLIGDPAGEDKKGADYTAFVVLGVGADRKIRLLDAVYDRINLTRRWRKFSDLHKKWKPLYSIYERLGKDPEVEYFREQMMREGYIFNIMEVGGTTKKEYRINRLVAPVEQGDLLFPRKLMYFSEHEQREIDIINILVNNEMRGYPMTDHDHMLDAMARLYDPEVPLTYPQSDFDPLTGEQRRKKDAYERESSVYGRMTWCAI